LNRETMTSMKTNQTIIHLMKRGYGGSEAVATPGDESVSTEHLPQGKPAPGVEEVLENLQMKLTEGETSSTEWVFLTGGPGNGKSHQVESLIKKLNPLNPLEKPRTGDLAKRKYTFEFKNARLIIVNDATIRKPGSSVGDLPLDLREALQKHEEKPTYLVVNINRGILIEEESKLDRDGGSDHDFEKKVINKIRQGSNTYYSYHVEDIPPVLGGGKVNIHAVYLDQVSLLESSPDKLDLETMGPGDKPPAYNVIKKLDDDKRLKSPTGKLLEILVHEKNFEGGACAHCNAKELCPFLANVNSLRNEEFRKGFLTVIRGLEIVSGHLITYRDLWGILCLAILGKPEGNVWSVDTPCSWVRTRVEKFERGGSRHKEYLLELYLHRIHEALFPLQLKKKAGLFNYKLRDAEEDDYVTKLKLNEVDPAMDVGPDWAQDVSAALEGVHFEKTISKDVGALKHVWFMLDKKLETSLGSDAGWKEDDTRRRLTMHWWGSSIYRLFGLAKGRPAYKEVIEQWVWLRTRKNNHEFKLEHDANPRPIAEGLNQLIYPKRNDRATDCLIPIFQARSEPVRGDVTPTWCYQLKMSGPSHPSWRVTFEGDSIKIKIYCGEKLICTSPLDFPLCREAMLFSQGPGFSELGELAMPRLERVRAALIGDSKTEAEMAIGLVIDSKFKKIDAP
jgi:hypothetical protein